MEINEQIQDSSNSFTQSLLFQEQTNKEHENNYRKTPFLAAIFGMMASALGTGIFNTPLRITQIGLGTFFIYVIIGGAYSYLGCFILQQMIVKKKFKEEGEMCQQAYGVGLKRLIQICLFLFPWGIAICYQVIISRFIVQLLYDVFKVDLYDNRDLQIYNSRGNLFRILINIGVIILNFGLIQMKDISKIQKLSTICVMVVIYNSVTIFVYSLTGFTHHGDVDVQYKGIFQLDWSIVQWFTFDSKSFSVHTQALASFLYCYINHQLVFPTCKNMENPTDQRLKSCFLQSVIYQLVFYIVVGASGYLLLVPHLDNLPIAPIVLASINAFMMTLGKGFMTVSLFIAVPLNLFPARTILKDAFGMQDTNRNHYLLSIGLAISTCTVAITFVGINSYFGLLGGTAGVLMSCALPALCYQKLIIRTGPRKDRIKLYLILIFIAIVSVIAFIGGVLSIVDPVS